VAGREVDRLPPSSTEVKNTWSYISVPLYILVASYFLSIKTFTFADKEVCGLKNILLFRNIAIINVAKSILFPLGLF
jgi:hypothetical protein